MGDAFNLQFGLIDLSVAQSIDVFVEIFELNIDVLAVWYHLVDLIVESAVGPGERTSVGCICGLDKRILRGTVLKHADRGDHQSVYFFQVQVGDFLVGDRLPEHGGQVQSEVPASPKAATHQRPDELKQTEVVGAVGFGVYHPFGLVLSVLMPVVGRRNEESQVVGWS